MAGTKKKKEQDAGRPRSAAKFAIDEAVRIDDEDYTITAVGLQHLTLSSPPVWMYQAVPKGREPCCTIDGWVQEGRFDK